MEIPKEHLEEKKTGMATFINKLREKRQSLPMNKVLISKFKKMRAPNYGSQLLNGFDTTRFDKKRHSETDKPFVPRSMLGESYMGTSQRSLNVHDNTLNKSKSMVDVVPLRKKIYTSSTKRLKNLSIPREESLNMT